MKKALILTVFLFANLHAENNYSTKAEWLMDTKTDKEKFQKIQGQLRGFDLAMVEVGYRFNSLYFAIKDKNYDLAQYNWDKIKKAIINGTQRRPKRKKSSEVIFLDKEYKIMSDALASKDEKTIQKEYENTKELCNSCHIAERVPFIRVIDPKYRWQPIE